MTERFLAYAIATAGVVALTAPALVSARHSPAATPERDEGRNPEGEATRGGSAPAPRRQTIV